MSNGESKIAESKAALCCGFAIALRALFIGDSLLGDSLPIDCFASARNDTRTRHCERAHWASAATNRQGIPIRWIATRLAPLAMTRDNDISSIQHG